MSTFEQSRSLFTQTHFTVIEIDLPSINGACTVGGEAGFGTPLTCDQASNATTTYKFTQDSAPLLPESGVLRLIKSISETPARLNSGRGLSSRGTGAIRMLDITGKDPNPNAPAVTDEVKNQGGYIAKLVARNILTNKPLRIKNYRLEVDGTIDMENGAQTRHYVIESVNAVKKGEFDIRFKDELSKVNIDETVWPLPLEGYLINDITNSQTTFNVDPNVNYEAQWTIRIGDELMKILAVSNIGTGSASITVNTRGTTISYTKALSKTEKDTHSLGDEIFVCEISDNERIDDLLYRILIDIGVDPSFIDTTAWAEEINAWHPTNFINTLWIESFDTFEALEKILTFFMIDMWFDPVDRLIKISAISAWQASTVSISEGNEIDFESITRRKEETLRATRALAIYDKRTLTNNDDIESYNKASLFVRTELESSDLFGEPKTKKFDPSFVLEKDSADLLTNRWVNRYSDPINFTWMTQERKLNFNTGDVVDIQDLTTVNFAGLPTNTARAQITSIKPNYTQMGRTYTVTGLSYEPTFSEGSEIIISGNYDDINLYIQFAGAPSEVVDLTFIFDAAIISGSNTSIAAVRAGGFAPGSKITIIMANGAIISGKGGAGGTGAGAVDNIRVQAQTTPPTNGSNGGVAVDAEGVDMDIYFSGDSSAVSTAYPLADGYIKAPAGGDGGFDAVIVNDSIASGRGGNSGKGQQNGNVGQAGTNTDLAEQGISGSVNTVFGIDGANNNATGGLAGSGVVDNGAVVTFYGETAARYINGNGDHGV